MRRPVSFLVLVLVVALASCQEQEAVPAPVPADTVTTLPPATTPTTAGDPTTTATTPEPATTTTLPPLRSLAYQEVFSLPFPTYLTERDDGLWVATKDGRVWRSVDEADPQVVLDLSGSVRNQGEQGLLGMAFHPTDPARVYLHYSAADDGDTVLSEFQVAEGSINPGSERVLLRLDQPASNHNGGMIQFGPDGLLYLGLGDGGGAADRFDNGQDRSTLLGGIVRIDVEGDPYTVPPDNPFMESEGADELWAYGLRNPWRFWIDRAAEEPTIYIADVGQSAFEEVNTVALDPVGYNFGWPITEGLHCFSPAQGCDTEGLTLPVLEVEHGDVGTCSITGGVVYRGSAIPELSGHYLYSDFCGGYLRSFRWDGSQVVDRTDWTDQLGVAGSVVSFGTDAAGEVYVLTTEAVLRLVAQR